MSGPFKMKGSSFYGRGNQSKSSPAKLVGAAMAGASHITNTLGDRLVEDIQERKPERKERRDLKSKIKTQNLKTELEIAEKGQRDNERKMKTTGNATRGKGGNGDGDGDGTGGSGSGSGGGGGS